MKNILYSLAFVSSLLFSSCEDTMNEKHDNSDAFSTTEIQYLFAKGALNTLESDYSDWYTYTFRRLATYTQTAARLEGKDRMNVYDIKNDLTRWENYYIKRMSPLSEVDKIYETLDAAGQAEHKVYVEAGRILKAYNTIIATDYFGNMPYSEAFTARNAMNGKEVILRPKYDTQKDIYYAILEDLKIAAAYFKTASFINHTIEADFTRQDVVYTGNLMNWYKFANSLRVRCAMRISNVDEAKAKQVLSEISMDDLITSNKENACIRIKGGEANKPDNSIWRAFVESHNKVNGYYAFAPEPMVNMLKKANDPRLSVFFQPASDDDGFVIDDKAEIIGYPVSADDAVKVKDSNTAEEIMKKYAIYNTTTFRENFTLPMGIGITAAEVALYLAEANQRGLYGGNAKDLYNKGVILSIQNYYGYYAESDAAETKVEAIAKTDVSDKTLLEWIEKSPYKFNSTQALEQIATQKWLHYNVMQPYECWAEYRRTDLPVLADDRDNGTLQNKENAPVRLMYSSSEASMNPDHYKAQAEYNDPYVRLWWDVK